ncbi:hypothetical protein [Xanthomonas phaseoli]|uniref:hypothetical protein n=1 Tax=Xanthomonas phaseoli TaxID=1985254 RepID=UPI001E3878BD|nr:hypothetical protein [Xanthomonas phaseoli]MCC8469894.1 hypothetical protein [Xanthomonas phaseoli]
MTLDWDDELIAKTRCSAPAATTAWASQKVRCTQSSKGSALRITPHRWPGAEERRSGPVEVWRGRAFRRCRCNARRSKAIDASTGAGVRAVRCDVLSLRALQNVCGLAYGYSGLAVCASLQ